MSEDKRVISEEAVEAAAETFYMTGPGGVDQHWDDLPKARMGHFRSRARAALEAATPYLLSHEREEARLAHLDAMVNRDS